MTYVKNGGMIRLVPDGELPRFLQRGFIVLSPVGAQLPKRLARKPKEGKRHGV